MKSSYDKHLWVGEFRSDIYLDLKLEQVPYIKLSYDDYKKADSLKNTILIFELNENTDYQNYVVDLMGSRDDFSILCYVKDEDMLQKGYLDNFNRVSYPWNMEHLGLENYNLVVGDKKKLEYFYNKSKVYGMCSTSIENLNNLEVTDAYFTIETNVGTITMPLGYESISRGIYYSIADVDNCDEVTLKKLVDAMQEYSPKYDFTVVFYSSTGNYPKFLKDVCNVV